MNDGAARFDATLYRQLHVGTPGDVDFYRRQCAGAQGVLELGCGDGRILAPLAAEGIAVDLLHYPSVKPFAADALVASASKTGGVVTVENQSNVGGLGGAVCEVLSEQCPTRVKRLGVPDQFGEVASEEYLFEKHGFGPAHIAAACRELAGKENA